MTPATIIGLISALFSIIKYLVETAQQNKWIDVGTAKAVLQGMQESNDAIARAQKARELVRSSIAAKPDSVRDHDHFERTGN